MINPEFIETFLSLAETGHFTETAKKRHMTQPGVSQHLQKLEAYFGIALIHKRGKSFTLTDAGKNLSLYGRRLFEEHSRFKEAIAVDDPKKGDCKFGSPGSFGLKVFDVLLESALKHSGLRVELMVAPNYSIVSLLNEKRIDVGFMTEEPKDKSVEAALYTRDELLLIVPKAFKKVPTLENLKTLGFVNHPDGFHNANRLLGENFPKEFRGMDQIPIRVFINQNNRILDPVAAGIGFAILPETTCSRYAGRSQMRLIRLKKRVEDPIYKVQRSGEALPSRYSQILAKLKK